MFVSLCEAWPLPPSGCPDLTSDGAASPEVTGAAVLAASEVLWELSGRRYGSCPVTVRPCRKACAPQGAVGWWWDGVGWPWGTPYPGTSLWLAAACGSCQGDCGCNQADTLTLPELAQSVTEVMVDGVVLDPSAYVLWDGRLLVRADGERWPLCQDWTVPVSGVGAWSVTMVVGVPVPMVGRFAMAELAAEFVALCTPGGVCRLPAYTTGVTRQGVTQSFPSAADLVKNGMVGLPTVDLFLRPPAPAGAAIWNPDDYTSGARRLGGAY